MTFLTRTTFVLFVQVAAYAAALVASVLVARALLDTAFGLFRIVQIAISYASQALYLGVEHAVAFHGARSDAMARVARVALRYGLVSGAGAVLLLLLATAIPAVEDRLVGSEAAVRVTLLVVPAAVVTALARGLALTQRDFLMYGLLYSLDRLIFLFLVVVGFVASSLVLGTALLAFTVAGISVGLLASLFLARSGRGAAGSDWAQLRSLLAYGLALYAGQWTLPSLASVAIVALSVTLGMASAGQFAVAAALTQMLLFLPAALAAVVTPEASRQHERDSREIVGTIVRWNFYLLIALGLALVPLAAPLTEWLYGEHYRDAARLLLVLVPGAVALGGATPVWSFHSSAGAPRENTRVGLSALALQVVLLAVLVPTLGSLGGALATSTAYGFAFVRLVASFGGGHALQLFVPGRSDRLLATHLFRRIGFFGPK